MLRPIFAAAAVAAVAAAAASAAARTSGYEPNGVSSLLIMPSRIGSRVSSAGVADDGISPRNQDCPA